MKSLEKIEVFSYPRQQNPTKILDFKAKNVIFKNVKIFKNFKSLKIFKKNPNFLMKNQIFSKKINFSKEIKFYRSLSAAQLFVVKRGFTWHLNNLIPFTFWHFYCFPREKQLTKDQCSSSYFASCFANWFCLFIRHRYVLRHLDPGANSEQIQTNSKMVAIKEI